MELLREILSHLRTHHANLLTLEFSLIPWKICTSLALDYSHNILIK